MSPFWSTMLSELRGRGRSGTLFLGVVFLLVSLAMFASVLSEDFLRSRVMPVVIVLGAFLLMFVGRTLWRALMGKHARGAVGELSCDELNKARSKLVNRQTRRTP